MNEGNNNGQQRNHLTNELGIAEEWHAESERKVKPCQGVSVVVLGCVAQKL